MWGCTSSLESLLASEAISSRFTLPGSKERRGAAVLCGSPSPRPSAAGPRLLSRRPRRGRGGSGCRQPVPRRADKQRAAGRWAGGHRGRGRRQRAGSGSGWAQARGKRCLVPPRFQGRDGDGSGCPPAAPCEEQGWGDGAFVAPLAGSWRWASRGTALSRECRVSSRLGASSLSLGWPASPSPAHRPLGATTPTMLGSGEHERVPAPSAAALGVAQPLPSRRRTGAPGLHESPHLPMAPSARAARGAASRKRPPPRLNGSFLAPAAATKGPLWARGSPGAKRWLPPHSSLCWAPPIPPGGGVPPASPIAVGGKEDGPTREGGISGGRGGGRASAAAMGACPGTLGWRRGALNRGQEPSWCGVGWCWLQPQQISTPLVHLSAAARWGDAAPALGARGLGCRVSSVSSWFSRKSTVDPHP